MKHFLQYALAAAACIGFLASPATAAYKQEYKLSVVPGATSGWGLSATYFADLVKERTNGRVNIKVYPGAQLMAGKQTSELLLVRNGAIDFALASTINWSPQLKQLNLTALPFFVANTPDRYKAMDAIEAGNSGKMLIAAIEKAGVNILTIHQSIPINSLADVTLSLEMFDESWDIDRIVSGMESVGGVEKVRILGRE